MIHRLSVVSTEMQQRVRGVSHDFTFTPGLNVIIGGNGTGKTTLFNLLMNGDQSNKDGHTKIVYDLGTKILGYRSCEEGRMKRDADIGYDPYRMAAYSDSLYKSNGEGLWRMVEGIRHLPDGITFMIDEPETALDVKRILELKKILRKESKRLQIIIATHNPILMFNTNVINVDPDPKYLDTVLEAYSLPTLN